MILGGPLSPVQLLLTSLGSLGVPAIYDGLTTSSITIATGVSNWADARGSGFGPALAQATGANQPTYTASTGAVSFNGTSHVLYSSTSGSSLFSLGQPTSFAIIASTSGWTAQNKSFVNLNNTGYTNVLGIGTASGSTAIRAVVQPSAASAAGALTNNQTHVRLYVASVGGGNVNLDIPNQARVSVSSAQPATSASVYMTLAGFNTTVGVECVIYAAIVIARVVTSADLLALLAYGSQYGVQTA